MNANDALACAIDVRRGFKRFKDVAAADRPLVAQALSKLSDAKMQELLSSPTRHGGFSTATHSRVG